MAVGREGPDLDDVTLDADQRRPVRRLPEGDRPMLDQTGPELVGKLAGDGCILDPWQALQTLLQGGDINRKYVLSIIGF